MAASGRRNTFAVSWLCSLGLFIAGYVFYSSSLIETFFSAEFSLTSWQTGMAQSAVPLGAIFGAILAGKLADKIGRHRLLVRNFLALVIVSLLSFFITGFYSLCTIRFFSGFLAGTLYPLCAAYLTEMTPDASIARQSAILMFINCLAAPAACVVAIVLSLCFQDHLLWRLISVCGSIPALIAYLWSRDFPESRAWLLCNEKNSALNLKSLSTLFHPNYRTITLCLLFIWFFMDIAYYGINFFVPYLLQTFQIKSLSANFSEHSLLSNTTIWGTLLINFFFMLGALAAIYVVEKIDLFKLQKYGFFYSSISLFLLAGYFYSGMHQTYMIILLFIIFNFALNIGPDVTTYLLSATSYPVEIRGSGHGLVAGFAKFGSFIGVLLLPKMQASLGFEWVILFLAVILFAAYLLTATLSRAFANSNNPDKGDIIYEIN